MKRLILQEDIPALNVHEPNHRASKYVEQKPTELQGEIDKETVTAGELNLCVSN